MKKQIGFVIVALYFLSIFINSAFSLCCCPSNQTQNQAIEDHNHDQENVNSHHHDDENGVEESDHDEKDNHCTNSPKENIQYLVMPCNVNVKPIEFEKIKSYEFVSLSVWLAFLFTDGFNNNEFKYRPPNDSYALIQPLYAPQSAILRL